MLGLFSRDTIKKGWFDSELSSKAWFDVDLLTESASPYNNNFSFTLTETLNTSAGIFDINSKKLVKTLWSNVSYAAGTHSYSWDGTDDDGNVLTPGPRKAIVMTNNITYSWSIIGNNSDTNYGESVIKYLRGMQDMTIVGSTAYFATGFQEGNPASCKINLSTSIHSKSDILQPVHGDLDLETLFVCSDGTIVYWCGIDTFDSSKSFTYGTNVADDLETNFSSGTVTNTIFGRTYNWAIDVQTSGPSASPTGIAVQPSGDYLFISHGGLGQLKVFNKTTGAFVRNITVTNPRNIHIDVNGYLWMVSSTSSVTKHTINSDGTISSAILTLSGISVPLAVQVTNDGNTVAVIDGGSSQQVKGFNTSTGASSWTLGTSGGYSSTPNITNTKFMFDHPYLTEVQSITRTFIAFKSDGSMFFGDPGNFRVMLFDSSRNFVDSIMATQMLYNSSFNMTNPDSVFANWIEYEIDGVNWTLKNNWVYNLNMDYIPDTEMDMKNFLRYCTTLSNGKTYAWLEFHDVTTIRYPELVELSPTTGMRYTGKRLDAFAVFSTDAQGNIYILDGNIQLAGSVPILYKQTLTGFSGADPTYSASTAFYTYPTVQEDEPLYFAFSSPWVTEHGKLVIFSPQKINTGMHFGLAELDVPGEYLWKVAPSTTTLYDGEYPNDGRFDIGNNVEYAGGNSFYTGRHVGFNYHGEFWKNSQVNKWHHYYDNGLLLNIFGITTPEAAVIDGKWAPRKAAGNAFSIWAMTLPSGELRFIGNDESVHSGLQRWETSNIDSITELETVFSTDGVPGHYILIAESNSITVTTNDATLTEGGSPTGYTLVADSTSISITDNDSGLLVSRNIIAANNSITVVGNNSLLNRGYRITAANNNINVNGNSSNILKNFRLVAANSPINVTDNTANIHTQRKITAENSSVNITVTDVNFLTSQLSPVDTTLVSIQDYEVGLRIGRKLVADSNSITVNTGDATFTIGKYLVAESSSINIETNNTNLLYSRILPAQGSEIVISGNSSNLSFGRKLLASNNSIDITSNNSLLKISRRLAAQNNSITVVGHDAINTSSKQLRADYTSVTIDSNDALLKVDRKLTAESNSILLDVGAANIYKHYRLNANNNGISVTSNNSGLLRGRRLLAASNNINVNVSDATMVRFMTKRRVIIIS